MTRRIILLDSGDQPLFPSQYLSGTIWLTLYLMVWDWRVSRAGPMPFCLPSCSLCFRLQLFSLYILFLYRLVVWAGIFGLIGCKSPSPGLALPIFFNNKNNNIPEHTLSNLSCTRNIIKIVTGWTWVPVRSVNDWTPLVPAVDVCVKRCGVSHNTKQHRVREVSGAGGERCFVCTIVQVL